MELIRSTDYFAAIPLIRVMARLEPNQPARNRACRQRVEADSFLIATVAVTAVAVAILISNWAH